MLDTVMECIKIALLLAGVSCPIPVGASETLKRVQAECHSMESSDGMKFAAVRTTILKAARRAHHEACELAPDRGEFTDIRTTP